MKILLHKTKNGWIVTDQDYLHSADIPECYVFESMRALTGHLLRLTGESGRRDSNGRFCGTKKEST